MVVDCCTRLICIDVFGGSEEGNGGLWRWCLMLYMVRVVRLVVWDLYRSSVERDG